MPCDYREYHPDWQWIVAQIRDQAGNCCEWCGVSNGSVGARDRYGDWHSEDMIDAMNSTVGSELFGEYPKIIRIVLTTAHLDHVKDNDDPMNLRYLCQRCHLNHDRSRHIAKAKRNRFRRRVEKGQRTFLEVA